LDRRTSPCPIVKWPASPHAGIEAARHWLRQYLEPDGTLATDPEKIAALIAATENAPTDVRRCLRVSRHFGPWLERLRRDRSRTDARAQFLAEVKAGTQSLDMLSLPLHAYQRAGMLHIASGWPTPPAARMW